MAEKREQAASAEKIALRREIANLKARMKIYEQQNRTLSIKWMQTRCDIIYEVKI